MSGKLILVGTPIGNLGDFSPRALDALNNCDFIAAEDTRVSMKLTAHFDIHKPMISYFEHNKFQKQDEIISRIQNGENCVLVTDAGMPVISDPGQELVFSCREQGIDIDVVPGPTAFATALAISGLPNRRFTFEGFLSTDKTSRRAHLRSLEKEQRTMIFYEAPHKLENTLSDLVKTFGEQRKIALVKELTKIYQKVMLCTLGEATAFYEKEENYPKGEFVIIVTGAEELPEENAVSVDASALAKDMCAAGLSKKDSARIAAKYSGRSKNEIYDELIKMQ